MPAKIAIAFSAGGIIPAAVIGSKEDVKVPPHEAVKVPETYGKQLIKDRIAYDPAEKAEADRKSDDIRAARAKVAADQRASKDVADLMAKLEASEKNSAGLTAALDDEKKTSADLSARLETAGKEAADAKAALDAANATITDLQAKLAEAAKPADQPQADDQSSSGEQ